MNVLGLMLGHQESRGPQRLTDAEWWDTLRRVRSEFEEMPCTRLTLDQARAFFGLGSDAASRAVLERLAEEGFLARTGNGEYVRRTDAP